MAPEIADSDAESDLGSPPRQACVPEHEVNTAPPRASPSVIDFDQFLDPTQRLSSSASLLQQNSTQLDGSGERHGQAQLDHTDANTQFTSLTHETSLQVTARKRAHSALHETSKFSPHGASGLGAKTKRPKTYGAASRARLSGHDEQFMSPQKSPSRESSPVPADVGIDASSDTWASALAHSTVSTTGAALVGSVFPMTTSMASMGQYQSINLDFRGGMDVNANPFGSPSQASAEDALNHPDHGDSGYTPFPTEVHPLPILPISLALNDGLAQALPAMSASSAERPTVVNPTQLLLADGEATTAVSEGHSTLLLQVEAGDTLGDIPMPSMEKPPLPKKRGRKPKNAAANAKSPTPGVDDMDELALSQMPQPRARQGTVDSVDSLSRASDASGSVSTARRQKRRKSQKFAEEQPILQEQSSPVKNTNGELNLSDETTIGLPKEAYKPRPSRSRSNKMIEAGPPAADKSTPVKPPSSGPNLSDEALIGLPRENYKPRPSRSRSKKSVDEEPSSIPLPEESDNQTPAKGVVDKLAEPSPSNKSSTTKGRKSKVKRAKTSAAALLRRDPMLSEGDEDVVWMDTKPAPVKLDLPPDIKALKKEPEGLESHTADEAARDTRGKSKGDVKAITVEIRNKPEAKNPGAEPKKRGRKPKTVQPKSKSEIVDEDEDEQGPQAQRPIAREALTEKSTNARDDRKRQATDMAKKTPTISPITSPEPEERPRSSTPLVPRKESLTVATPAKPLMNAPPSSAEKGPTKHSPINPPGTKSGRKTIYRVGLSRRQNIPSLLRKVDRDKPPPKNVAIKQKEKKQRKDENDDGENGNENDPNELRGVDGMLVEWEF
jgi:hypothetical protein